MPTVEVDPATEPFLPGTDQRDALLPDEPGSIRLRSLEHEEERYRIADKPRRGALPAVRPSRRTLVFLALAVVLLSLFPLQHQSLRTLLSTSSESFARYNKGCNPYAQRGVLRIDVDDWSGNCWEPTLATDCQPRDYLSQIYRDGRNLSDKPGLDFLRDRVILLFGDSIDRGFLEHFCRIFALGRFEHIGPGHEFDPPLPLGREHAPPGYRSDRGAKDWVGIPMGRPSLCYLPSYNTYLLNVFQFGLYPEDETVIHFTHFLPPGGFEDRFDTFVVPILERLAQNRTKSHTQAEQEAGSASLPRVLPPLRRPISAAPDLITLTATFWNLMRHPNDEEDPDSSPDPAKSTLATPTSGADKNATKPAWIEKLGNWAPPTRARQDWWERRVQSGVRHVGRAWGGAQSGSLILWRTLHMATTVRNWHLNKQYSQNEVAHRVVEVLQAEGRAAESASSWADWRTKVVPTLGETWETVDREAVRGMGLGKRLGVLDWGKLFVGQEVKHTSDGIHPHPPGCWAYWNMLFDSLRRHVELQLD